MLLVRHIGMIFVGYTHLCVCGDLLSHDRVEEGMGHLCTVMLEHVDHELTCCFVKSINMESSPSSND